MMQAVINSGQTIHRLPGPTICAAITVLASLACSRSRDWREFLTGVEYLTMRFGGRVIGGAMHGRLTPEP